MKLLLSNSVGITITSATEQISNQSF